MPRTNAKPQPVVIPGILVKTKADFTRRITELSRFAPIVHVDVMDGTLVPHRTWANAHTVSKLRPTVQIELHLMVNDPLPFIIDWMKVKGFQRALVHAESRADLKEVIDACRERCIEIVLAISPGTPLTRITKHLKCIDGVLVLGNKPGKSGQVLDPKRLELVRALRKKAPTLPIGFDIGVNRDTIADLVRAGVTRPVSTSAIANADSPEKEFKLLTRRARQAAKS